MIAWSVTPGPDRKPSGVTGVMETVVAVVPVVAALPVAGNGGRSSAESQPAVTSSRPRTSGAINARTPPVADDGEIGGRDTQSASHGGASRPVGAGRLRRWAPAAVDCVVHTPKADFLIPACTPQAGGVGKLGVWE